MQRITRIVLSTEALEVCEEISRQITNKRMQSLSRSIQQKIECIRYNSHYGLPIAKVKIPQRYIEKYDIHNLFRVELPQFWRMLYAVQLGQDGKETIILIIAIIDHKEYNKLFGYKNH